MTLGGDSQLLESYVPVYDAAPEKWEDARAFLVEHLKKISNAVNVRTIGWYLDQELLAGNAFIPGANIAGNASPQQFRQVLRMVVNFGPLPNAGTKSVPHGIVFNSNFTLINLYAAATDPIALIGFPIPYADPIALINAVALTIDSTNVNITTGTNKTNFTRCYVVIEYLQEI